MWLVGEDLSWYRCGFAVLELRGSSLNLLTSSLNLLKELEGKEMSRPWEEEGMDTRTPVLHVCSIVSVFRLRNSQEDTCISTKGPSSAG